MARTILLLSSVMKMCLAVLSPLVLATDLLLLLGGEVIGDVEGLTNLFGRLALDHVGNGLASNIKKGLDVKMTRWRSR